MVEVLFQTFSSIIGHVLKLENFLYKAVGEVSNELVENLEQKTFEYNTSKYIL